MDKDELVVKALEEMKTSDKEVPLCLIQMFAFKAADELMNCEAHPEIRQHLEEADKEGVSAEAIHCHAIQSMFESFIVSLYCGFQLTDEEREEFMKGMVSVKEEVEKVYKDPEA